MDAADESARTRPAKADTTHLRDAATAILKGTGNECFKKRITLAGRRESGYLPMWLNRYLCAHIFL